MNPYDPIEQPVEWQRWELENRSGDGDRELIGPYLNPEVTAGVGPGDDGSGYYAGDEYTIPNSWSVERRASVQYRLVSSGWLDPGKIAVEGDWGVATARAFASVLSQANATGTSWRVALDRSLGAAQDFRRDQERSDQLDASRRLPSGGGGGARRAPFQARVSNPDDLRATFKEVARQATGGVFVDDAQIENMVTTFQANERRSQRQAYDGGEVVDAPSANAVFEDKVDDGSIEANRFAQITALLMQETGA